MMAALHRKMYVCSYPTISLACKAHENTGDDLNEMKDHGLPRYECSEEWAPTPYKLRKGLS